MRFRLRIGLLGLACAGTAAAGCTKDTNRNPESCEDIQRDFVDDHDDFPEDGEYTVYVDGEKSRPWTVWCENMNRDEPKDYLTVHAADNFSEVSNGKDVLRTEYERVRIDPIRFEIDPWDATFASTGGSTILLNDDDFEKAVGIEMPNATQILIDVPLGVAFRVGTATGPVAIDADAHVDLAETGFVLAEDVLEDRFFCAKQVTGTSTTGLSKVELSDDLRDIAMSANDTTTATEVIVSADCENYNEGTRIPLQYDGLD